MKASLQFKRAVERELRRLALGRPTEQAVDAASLQREIAQAADLSRSLTKKLHNLSVRASRMGMRDVSDVLGEANRAAVDAHAH